MAEQHRADKIAHDEAVRLIHEYYWQLDDNCAASMLKFLAHHFGCELNQQLLDAATGMHGAGGYRAQCGLLEGGLLFIGLHGAIHGLEKQVTINLCHDFAQAFEKHFSSLSCRELRPQGFSAHDAPHQCEELTIKAVVFAQTFIEQHVAGNGKFYGG